MKKIKIMGNDGNTIYTDLDITNNEPPKDHSNVVYVTYGETTKSEMLEHIEHKDYMICLYHTEGYNTAFVYPMVAVINYSHHGTEMVEFVNNWIDGEIKHITYNVSTDTWSER